MNTILAIETSAPVCSVALKKSGQVYSRSASGSGIHSEATFLFTEELLRESGVRIRDLDAVIVSGGPGSYTGLRIAASAVKGMLFSAEIPLFAANTLAALSVPGLSYLSDKKPVRLHAVLNARRTHLYHQAFVREHSGVLRSVCEPAIRSLELIATLLEPHDIISGTAIERLPAELLEKHQIMQIRDSDALRADSLFEMLTNPLYADMVKQVDPKAYEPLYSLAEHG